MSKTLSAKCCQDKKERLQKKKSSWKILKSFLRRKRKKATIYFSEDVKQKLFEYRKRYYRIRKNV